MNGSATVRPEQLSGISLMRIGLAKMVAAIRGAIVVTAITSALLGMGKPLSWWWLLSVLAGVVIWTSLYVAVAWARGLHAWLIGIDLLLACLMCLAIGKLVSAHAIPGTQNWVEIIASMVVVAAQLAGTPILSIPAGLLVAASYVTGSRLAHSADGGAFAGLVLGSQAVVAALVMVVSMRAERAAVRAFTNLEQEQAATALGTTRRDEERAQLRLVHSGPLTTLAMALHANAGYLREVVRQRAAAARQDLQQLSAPTSPSETTARLDERLAQVVLWYQPTLKITTRLPECSVPVDTAEAFARGVAEALENVVRHAQTEQAWIELRDHGRTVQVTVTDRGRGFNLDQVSPFGFGLREDLSGRMAAVGGTAAVLTSPGAGTVVQLEWCRD